MNDDQRKEDFMIHELYAQHISKRLCIKKLLNQKENNQLSIRVYNMWSHLKKHRTKENTG